MPVTPTGYAIADFIQTFVGECSDSIALTAILV